MNASMKYNPIQNKSIPLTGLVIPTKYMKGRVIVIRLYRRQSLRIRHNNVHQNTN